METICGRYDVAQGRTPRNVQAASAIALLLQQSGGRVRQRARAVSSFVEQIVKMAVDLVGTNYTVDRIIRVEGEDGVITNEHVSPQELVKTKQWMDPLTGQIFEETYIPEMDIEVVAGTETPTSRVYYSELAMQLFKAGVIDEDALLDTLQFPRWREIIARKRAIQQAQEQQQIGTQPQQPGGSIPPELAGMVRGAQAQQGSPGGQQITGREMAALADLIGRLQKG